MKLSPAMRKALQDIVARGPVSRSQLKGHNIRTQGRLDAAGLIRYVGNAGRKIAYKSAMHPGQTLETQGYDPIWEATSAGRAALGSAAPERATVPAVDAGPQIKRLVLWTEHGKPFHQTVMWQSGSTSGVDPDDPRGKAWVELAKRQGVKVERRPQRRG